MIANVDVGQGYSTLFSGSFGSSGDVGFFLLASVPMVLIGAGVAVPYRAGLFNIGGEGQLIVGALAAVVLATKLPAALGGSVSFLLPLLAAAAAGAAWGAIAGILKAWRGVSEIVSTILLSFLGLLLVQYLISGPLQGPGVTYPATAEVPIDYQIGQIGPNAVLPGGFIVAVALILILWATTEFTRAGWRARLVGLNQRVAARQGVSVPREQVVAMAIGGALAGLGGASDALGNQLHVGLAFSPGWGYDAVAIALLARGNVLAVLPFGLYFAFLQNGSVVLQTELGVSPNLVTVIAGAPVMLVAAVIGYRAYRRAVGTFQLAL